METLTEDRDTVETLTEDRDTVEEDMVTAMTVTEVVDQAGMVIVVGTMVVMEEVTHRMEV